MKVRVHSLVYALIPVLLGGCLSFSSEPPRQEASAEADAAPHGASDQSAASQGTPPPLLLKEPEPALLLSPPPGKEKERKLKGSDLGFLNALTKETPVQGSPAQKREVPPPSKAALSAPEKEKPRLPATAVSPASEKEKLRLPSAAAPPALEKPRHPSAAAPPAPEEIGEEAFPVPPPPEVPEADGVAAAQRQRSKFGVGLETIRPAHRASSLPFPGSESDQSVLALPRALNQEEINALGLLAKPSVPPPESVEPAEPGPPVQLRPTSALVEPRSTPTSGVQATAPVTAPKVVEQVDRSLRPLVLILPFTGGGGVFHARLVEEGVGSFLKEQEEPLHNPYQGSPPFKSLPTPHTIEGASALARMGIGYLVMGTLEDTPGGFLTLELYRPPKSGVVWATSASMADPTRPERALRLVMEKLLERLRQEHDHILPHLLVEPVALTADSESVPSVKEPLPLAAREIKRLAQTQPHPAGEGGAFEGKTAAKASPKADLPLLAQPRGGGENLFEVQTGAFQSRQSADAEVDTLKQRGYEARVITQREKKGTWYMVRVGTFPNREQADVVSKELRRRWLLDAFPTRKSSGE